MALRSALVLLVFLPWHAGASEQRYVPLGQAAVLRVAPCIDARPTVRKGAVEVLHSDAGPDYAIYQAPSTLGGPASEDVTLVAGTVARDSGAQCSGGVETRYTVSVDRTPDIPEDALSKAFRVLMLALVIAIVLEQAFALLFNWRVFLEFAVGKAWRTPLLFGGALLVVRSFDLDLVASLLQAYRPPDLGFPSAGNWFTSILTAMVLGGGSSGVNRILVSLKFRSPLPEQPPAAKLDETQAWVSLEVDEPWEGGPLEVILQPEAAGTGRPATVSVLQTRSGGSRLWALFFPNKLRFPSSGGYTVVVGVPYRIGLQDHTGQVFNLKGKKVESSAALEVYCFGPRAVVDYHVKLPPG